MFDLAEIAYRYMNDPHLHTNEYAFYNSYIIPIRFIVSELYFINIKQQMQWMIFDSLFFYVKNRDIEHYISEVCLKFKNMGWKSVTELHKTIDLT